MYYPPQTGCCYMPALSKWWSSFVHSWNWILMHRLVLIKTQFFTMLWDNSHSAQLNLRSFCSYQTLVRKLALYPKDDKPSHEQELCPSRHGHFCTKILAFFFLSSNSSWPRHCKTPCRGLSSIQYSVSFLSVVHSHSFAKAVKELLILCPSIHVL